MTSAASFRRDVQCPFSVFLRFSLIKISFQRPKFALESRGATRTTVPRPSVRWPFWRAPASPSVSPSSSFPRLRMQNALALIRFDIFRFALRAHVIAAAIPHISPLFCIEGAPIVVDELFLGHSLSSPKIDLLSRHHQHTQHFPLHSPCDLIPPWTCVFPSRG
jgi:hypothetical protein